MKKFSLLSLLAIAALSVSISHAAAEHDPFQERIYRQDGAFVGFKEVGPDNWVYCEAIDKDGDLVDPKNWKRINDIFYRMDNDGTNINFIMRLEGGSVASKAGKFGGQVKPKGGQTAKASKKAAGADNSPASAGAAAQVGEDEDGETGAGETDAVEEDDAEDEAKLRRQNDLLFPPDGGEEESALNQEKSAKPGRFMRSWRNFLASVDQATAVMPEHKAVYVIGEGEEMRWNRALGRYEYFTLVAPADGSDVSTWEKMNQKRYRITRFDEDRPFFKADEDAEDKEDAAHEDEGKAEAEEKENHAAQPNQAPAFPAIAISSPADVNAALEGGTTSARNNAEAESAFDGGVKHPRKRGVLSSAWDYAVSTSSHVVRSAHQATVVPDQVRPRRRPVRTSVLAEAELPVQAAAAEAKAEAAPVDAGQSKGKKSQATQSWRAYFGGAVSSVKSSIEAATAVEPKDEDGGQLLSHEGQADGGQDDEL